MTGRVVRLVAGTLGVLAASLGALVVTSPGAQAAACTTPTGVTVVVDHHQLGGGVEIRCVPRGGGKDAATDFAAAGFDLSYVQRQPGFVCRVDGAPSTDPCVNTPPADAYWSLWWTDGTTGSWSYSSLGAGSLTLPAGSLVALSWQGGGGRATPRAPASLPAASASPTASGSPSVPPIPTSSASATPTPATPASSPTLAGNPTPPRTAHPSALRASQKPHRHPSHTTSTVSPAPSSTASAKATPRPSRRVSNDSSGLPGWVAPVSVVGLFAVAAAVAVVRRRRGGA